MKDTLTQDEFAEQWASIEEDKFQVSDEYIKRLQELFRKDHLEKVMVDPSVNHAWIPNVVKLNETKNQHYEIIADDDYEFRDENGNVIEAKKIVLEKKKPKYPECYEECCEVLNVPNLELAYNTDYSKLNLSQNEWKWLGKYNALHRLRICRDAYWYCYAKENNMPFNWKPEWSSSDQEKFTIRMYDGYRHFGHDKYLHSVLAFPTAEMRDAFYENFKGLIEECKELL